MPADRLSQQRIDPIELLVLGASWLAVATSWAALFVATPLLRLLLFAPGRSLPVQIAIAALAPAIPIAFGVAGAVRLREAMRLFGEPEPIRPLVARVPLPARPRLGDGRPAPEIAVGRFGAAVFRRLPGGTSVQRCGDRFEFHVDGEWVPFDEAARDSSEPALRAVPGDEDGDFVAKVYAAIVTTPGSIDEKPGCAILRPDQILPFLAGMPLAAMDLRRAKDPISALVA